MTQREEALQKLVNDDIVTVDADGTIRFTEATWMRMTTVFQARTEPRKPYPPYNRKEDRDDT